MIYNANRFNDILANISRNKPEPEPVFCPICGTLVGYACNFLPFPQLPSLDRFRFSPIIPSHTYKCKNLRICFCDDCLSGMEGVDIICKVIEATPEIRASIEHECKLILDARKKENREKLKVWSVCIGILISIIGICCLIWDVASVLIVAGTVLFLVTLNLCSYK